MLNRMQTHISWHQDKIFSNSLQKLCNNKAENSRFIDANTAKEEVGIGILPESSGNKDIYVSVLTSMTLFASSIRKLLDKQKGIRPPTDLNTSIPLKPQPQNLKSFLKRSRVISQLGIATPRRPVPEYLHKQWPFISTLCL